MFIDGLTASRSRTPSANLFLQALRVPYLDFIQHSETPVRVRLDACRPSVHCFGPTRENSRAVWAQMDQNGCEDGLGQCLCIQVGKHWQKGLCQSWGITAVWRSTTMPRCTWDLVSIRGCLSSKQESTPITRPPKLLGEPGFALKEGDVSRGHWGWWENTVTASSQRT